MFERLAVLWGAIALSACVQSSAFHCQDDGQCMDDGIEGICAGAGYCAFPDAQCDAGFRYGAGAPSGLSDQCLDVEGSSGENDENPHQPSPMGTTSSASSTFTASDADADDSLGSSESSDGVESSSSTGGSGDDEDVFACVTEVAAPVGSPAAAVASNVASNDFESNCASSGTNDIAFEWTAPAAGYYVFDAQGSSFEPEIYVLDGCEGEPVLCGEQRGEAARRVGRFEQGQRVVVVVEGLPVADANVALNINPVTCPATDLTDADLPATFSNLSGSSVTTTSCGGDGPERSFRFVAEETGLHSFRVTSGDFDPVLNVIDGPECDGPALQCNATVPRNVGSEVVRELEAGEVVTLVVDSAMGAGDFELSSELLPYECASVSLSEAVFPMTMSDVPHSMTTSCSNAGRSFAGAVSTYRAATFSWESPGQLGTASGCTLRYEGGFPAAISLQEGTCDGPETQCDGGEFDLANETYTSSVFVGHIPPTAFTVTVAESSYDLPTFGAEFEVVLDCFVQA